MDGIICEAIEKKRRLQFSYDDLTRIVEPHLFGRKTSGNDANMLDETFSEARAGYNPNDGTMVETYCKL